MKTNKEKVRNVEIKKQNRGDNPIADQEAQNVTAGKKQLSGSDAKKATRKANEGDRQGQPNNNEEDLDAEFEPGARAAKDSTAASRNKAKLGADESYTEIPEMKDIPGQEHIHNAGVPGEMADTTISSDDEEGVRDGEDLLSEEDEDVEIVMGTEADVTKDDLVLLGDPDADNDLNEDELVINSKLDDIDDEGDALNESGSDASGRDLDIPEGEDDDDGNADEENNYYSLGGDEKDDTDNGTPNEYRK